MKILSIYNDECFRVFKFLGIKIKFRDNTLHHLLNISRKLAMPDSVFRVKNTLFYVPNFPIDEIQRTVVNNQDFYEIKTLKILDKYIKDNAVILDIGSNIGNHTLYWSIERNAKKIFAFEPVKETFGTLETNIALNQLLDKVVLYNAAVGSQTSKAKIKEFDSKNIGATSLVLDENGSISVLKIDDLSFDGENGAIFEITVLDADKLPAGENIFYSATQLESSETVSTTLENFLAVPSQSVPCNYTSSQNEYSVRLFVVKNDRAYGIATRTFFLETSVTR